MITMVPRTWFTYAAGHTTDKLTNFRKIICIPITKLFAKIKISKIVKSLHIKKFAWFTLSRLRGAG